MHTYTNTNTLSMTKNGLVYTRSRTQAHAYTHTRAYTRGSTHRLTCTHPHKRKHTDTGGRLCLLGPSTKWWDIGLMKHVISRSSSSTHCSLDRCPVYLSSAYRMYASLSAGVCSLMHTYEPAGPLRLPSLLPHSSYIHEAGWKLTAHEAFLSWRWLCWPLCCMCPWPLTSDEQPRSLAHIWDETASIRVMTRAVTTVSYSCRCCVLCRHLSLASSSS